jgi:hypothetical protein
MTAVAFDTHRVVKRLKDAGFNDHQAETVTDILKESREADLSQLFTKRDGADLARDLRQEMDLLRRDLRQDMDLLRRELRQEMELLKRDLTIRLGGMVVVAVGAVAALVKLL